MRVNLPAILKLVTVTLTVSLALLLLSGCSGSGGNSASHTYYQSYYRASPGWGFAPIYYDHDRPNRPDRPRPPGVRPPGIRPPGGKPPGIGRPPHRPSIQPVNRPRPRPARRAR